MSQRSKRPVVSIFLPSPSWDPVGKAGADFADTAPAREDEEGQWARLASVPQDTPELTHPKGNLPAL